MNRALFALLVAIAALPTFASAQTTASTTPLVPVCTITVNPSVVGVGDSALLRWSSLNAQAGTITRIGSVGPSGQVEILPGSASRVSFVGTFFGPGGTTTCSAIVTVSAHENGISGSGGGGGGEGGGYVSGGTYIGSYGPGEVYTATPYTVSPPSLQPPTNNSFSQTPGVLNNAPSTGDRRASWLVPCGGTAGIQTNPFIATDCNLCSVGQLIQRIINFLVLISIPISAGLFAWAGIKLFIGGGAPANWQNARNTFKNIAIGLVVVLCGYLIVQTLINALLNPNFKADGWTWNNLQCSQQERPRVSPVSSIFEGLWQPSGRDVPILGNPTAPRATGQTLQQLEQAIARANDQYLTAFQAACGGDRQCIASLQTVCALESSCTPIAGCNNAGACGMMQIKPETACGTPGVSVPGCAGGQVTDRAAVVGYLSNPETAVPLAGRIFTADQREVCGGDATCAAQAYNGGRGAVLPSTCCSTGTRSQCAYDCNPGSAHQYSCDRNPDQPGAACRANLGYNETRQYIDKFNQARGFACQRIGC